MPLALNPKDVVYTPDDVARDVVNFFKPTGRILEPSAGDGAFLKWLPPNTDWCEIEKGRDFFANHEHYDWIIGNPPYSNWNNWLTHSFELADNIVYLVPITKAYSSLDVMQKSKLFGGVKTIFVLGTGAEIGFDFGFASGAIHFQRGYKGGTFTYFRNQINQHEKE